MRRLLTIASVLLGLGTVAAAQPSVPWWHDYGRDRYDRQGEYDQRVDDSGQQRVVMLANDYVTATGNHIFDVGAQAGRFSRLRIQPTRGAPFIRKVAVVFMNGQQQGTVVNRPLDRGALVIDLQGN